MRWNDCCLVIFLHFLTLVAFFLLWVVQSGYFVSNHFCICESFTFLHMQNPPNAGCCFSFLFSALFYWSVAVLNRSSRLLLWRYIQMIKCQIFNLSWLSNHFCLCVGCCLILRHCKYIWRCKFCQRGSSLLLTHEISQ